MQAAAEPASAGGRQREGSARAAVGAVLRPDPAAVSLDEAAGDREAKAGAAVGAGAVGAPKGIEHALGRVRCQPFAGVLDADEELARLPLEVDGDGAVGGCVAERVGQ